MALKLLPCSAKISLLHRIILFLLVFVHDFCQEFDDTSNRERKMETLNFPTRLSVRLGKIGGFKMGSLCLPPRPRRLPASLVRAPVWAA
eukprot:scaffold568_cov233-Pinguiococcus_pyrenoidosus.AAC.1